MTKNLTKRVSDLFASRDKAVSAKNQDLLLSTQIGEIAGSGSLAYLECSKMQSYILQLHEDEQANTPTYIVFVKEFYWHEKADAHSGYLLYEIKEVNKELKITKVVYL